MSSLSKSKKSANKQHILFLNYYFPPMGGGGVQRITKFLKYFDYQEYAVSVITVKPSFFYTTDRTLCGEIPEQVRVIRSGSLDPFRLLYLLKRMLNRRSAPAATTGNESSSFLRKLAMSIFVPDSRLLWLPFALLAIHKLQRQQKIDVIIASMPPFTTGLIGAFARRLSKIPLILDYRDAWNENPYMPRIGPIHRYLSRKMEQFCVRQADGFVFVNPALARQYQRDFSAIAEHPNIVVRNGFDEDDFPETKPPSSSTEGRSLEIGIMGTVYSHGNRPLSLLQTINRWSKEDPDLKDRLSVTFLGKWAPEFQELIDQRGLGEYVRFLPYLPHQEALQRARQFDVLALAIEDNRPGSSAVTPGRIYEYLRLRKPILAMCPPDSDLADLVRECKAGEVVEYGDRQGIKAVIEKWLQSGSILESDYCKASLTAYSRRHLANQLMAFLQEI